MSVRRSIDTSILSWEINMPARLLVTVCLLLAIQTSWAAAGPQTAGPRTAHIVVALCDNFYQRIVPVPLKIGNGQNPADNLYWGAAYGVRTFFKKQPEWQLLAQLPAPEDYILERLIFKHKNQNLYLVADAWDGSRIKEATVDFLEYTAGKKVKKLSFAAHKKSTSSAKANTEPVINIEAGGKAEMLIYVGHNGLMDFSLPETPEGPAGNQRKAAVFACQSNSYFASAFERSKAVPLITTTGNMCPEAYTSHALLSAWIAGASNAAVKEKVAAAYNLYQKCGIKGARRLFATP